MTKKACYSPIVVVNYLNEIIVKKNNPKSLSYFQTKPKFIKNNFLVKKIKSSP